MFEPLDTMAEAALALCSGDADTMTGRIAYSLQLLVELQRPVHDLHGVHLLDGWQPLDLPAVIGRQEEYLASQGWPDHIMLRPRTQSPTVTPTRNGAAAGIVTVTS